MPIFHYPLICILTDMIWQRPWTDYSQIISRSYLLRIICRFLHITFAVSCSDPCRVLFKKPAEDLDEPCSWFLSILSESYSGSLLNLAFSPYDDSCQILLIIDDSFSVSMPNPCNPCEPLVGLSKNPKQNATSFLSRVQQFFLAGIGSI